MILPYEKASRDCMPIIHRTSFLYVFLLMFFLAFPMSANVILYQRTNEYQLTFPPFEVKHKGSPMDIKGCLWNKNKPKIALCRTEMRIVFFLPNGARAVNHIAIMPCHYALFCFHTKPWQPYLAHQSRGPDCWQPFFVASVIENSLKKSICETYLLKGQP